MKISKLPLFAAILPLAATPFLVPAQVHADTYQIFDLGSTNAHDLIGIDNLGQVVILNVNTGDYLTYSNGVLVNTTSTLPSLTYDNGTPCSAPPGFSAPNLSSVVCNNGRIGFESLLNPNGEPNGLYTGPISSLTLLEPFGGLETRQLNSSGDITWINGQTEENFEAIDLTTPEPSSLLLVGTGFVSLFGVLRRKLS
jgi:hypothetical protein